MPTRDWATGKQCVLSVAVHPALWLAVRKHARRNRETVSDLLRRAIRAELDGRRDDDDTV
jgi:hypothetical protein